MTMTMREAYEKGQGTERPFRCEVHDDHQASASLNVLKGVWVCYACGAKGTYGDKKKSPSYEDLEAMLEPEISCRVYSSTYLEMFDNELGNWPTRFTGWARRKFRLGCDPLTGDATFPVRTPGGLLAGVGRRKGVVWNGPRYVYPRRWSASRAMFAATMLRDGVYVLTEGAGDSVAVAEAGANALACYGAGVHVPQLELIARFAPKLIVLGFDADQAGSWAADRAEADLRDLAEVVRADWSSAGAKDPAELDIPTRRHVLAQAVRSTALVKGWAEAAAIAQARDDRIHGQEAA